LTQDVWDAGIQDVNDYDIAMYKAYADCLAKSNGEKFYIIGRCEGDDLTLNHEIAHALYYLNPEYKDKSTKLVEALTANLRKSFNKFLKRIGYTTHVYIDETQAFFATGLGGHFEVSDEVQQPFIDLFNETLAATKAAA
jgi:hypothetical protein